MDISASILGSVEGLTINIYLQKATTLIETYPSHGYRC